MTAINVNISNSCKIKIFDIILFLFFLYSTRYVFLPYSIPTTYISLAVILILSIKNIVLVNPLSIISSILFLLIALISYVANQGASVDEYMLKTAFVYLVIIVFFPSYIMKVGVDNVIKILGIAGIINAFFILGMLSIPVFQSLYLSLIDLNAFELIGGEKAFNSLMKLRMIGINGLSVYTTGYIQSLCGIMYLYYISNLSKIKIVHALFLGAIMLSAIVAARSALIGCLIIIVLGVIYLGGKNLIKVTVISMITLSSLLIIIIMVLPDGIREFFTSWLSEFFVSGKDTASLQANIKIFSYGLKDFSFIGDSRWYGNNNDYYMGSDVGWYRLIFSVGILGATIWCFLMVSLIGWRNIFSLKISKETVFSWAMILYLTAMMFKGAIAFDSFQSIVFIMIFKLLNIQKHTVKT